MALSLGRLCHFPDFGRETRELKRENKLSDLVRDHRLMA